MSGDVTPKCFIPWEIHILSGCSKLKISYKLTRNPGKNRRFMSGSVVYKWGGLVRTWEPTQTFDSISSPALVKMKDANLELLNPQSNAIFPGSFHDSLVWEFKVSSKSILQSVDKISQKRGFFFILRCFAQVGDIFVCVFNQNSSKNTRHHNPRCFTGKLLELPGNTVEGAQENIGRTYDVAAFTSVLGRMDGRMDGRSLVDGCLVTVFDVFKLIYFVIIFWYPKDMKYLWIMTEIYWNI